MPLWTLGGRRRLISCSIDHRFCILNDLPHFLYLFCIFIVMCADHGQVTTLNYFKNKKMMDSCFDVCTLLSARHPPGIVLGLLSWALKV